MTLKLRLARQGVSCEGAEETIPSSGPSWCKGPEAPKEARVPELGEREGAQQGMRLQRGRGEVGEGFVCYFRSEGREGLRRGETSSDLFPEKGPSTTSGTVVCQQMRTEAGRPGWKLSPVSR